MTTVSSTTPTTNTTTPTTSTATTSSGTSNTTTASTAAAATLNFDSFLQLMIAELKNQDPTAPSDPTQYLTQISQMSGVQQGILTNTKLDSMLTTSSLTQAEGAIGKVVTSADGSTTGTVQSVALSSDGTATATLDTGKTIKLDNTVTVADTGTGTGTGTGAAS